MIFIKQAIVSGIIFVSFSLAGLAHESARMMVPAEGAGTLLLNLKHPRNPNNGATHIYEFCFVWQGRPDGKLTWERKYLVRRKRRTTVETESSEMTEVGQCRQILVRNSDRITVMSTNGLIQMSYRLVK